MQTEVGCDSSVSYKERIAMSLQSLNGTDQRMNGGFTRETKFFENDLAHSSPDTSGASTPAHESLENEFSSMEEGTDDHEEEIDSFIKQYVLWLFDAECEISYENKAKFGELMKDASARMSFAKYIDAHRNLVKCVDETTFYKLLHSFALVLFECGEADDYLPGKSLMNMAFTYYFIPDQRMVSADAFSSGESLSSQSTNGGQMPSGRSDSDNGPPKKRTFMQRFQKDLKVCKQIFQDTPSFEELKQGIWRRKPSKSTSDDDEHKLNYSRPASEGAMSNPLDIYSPSVKNFLFKHLKNQAIWKSLRFWNAAFFSAVHAERKRRCSQGEWIALSHDEQESMNDAIVNITFGQLGTFINNMKCLGLDNDTCMEFLRKQSVIGGIEEGGQYYQMLLEQIEDDCTF